MPGKLIVIQLQREYWEHRGLFLFIPLICALIVASFCILGVVSDATFRLENEAGTSSLDPALQKFLIVDETGKGFKLNLESNEFFVSVLAIQQFIGWWFFTMISLFLTLTYCASCLFADRKSRDILFWRSLPVSELFNVLMKLVVVVISVPLLTLLMNTLTSVLLLLVIGVWLGEWGQFVNALQALPLLSNYLFGSIGLVPLMLPIFAWTMLASAYAKKSPFLGASFIPLILLVADRFLNKFMGINIHIYELLKTYLDSIGEIMQVSFGDASNGYVSFSFNYSAEVASYSVIVAVFLSVVIWLRNNRYEI
jgi:ABC-2 type transport system permease protein